MVIGAAAAAVAGCGSSSNSSGASSGGGSAGAASGSSASGASGSIKVGWIEALTGPGNVFQQDNANGINTALAAVNANPPGGHKIVLVRADDATDPTTAAQACARLVNQDHVTAIIGNEIAAAQAACNVYAEKAGVSYIENAPGAGTYCASNTFNTGPTNEQAANPLIDYLVSHGLKKVYFLGSNAAAPKLTFQIAEKELKAKGGTVAGVSFEPLGTSDWSPDLAKIASSGADAVFEAVPGQDDVPLHKEYATNPQVSKIQQADLVYLPVITPIIGPKNVNGLIIEASYLPTVTSPASTSFMKAVTATGSKVPPFQDAAFLDYSVHLLANAIAKSGSHVTSASILKALPGDSYTGPAGTWTFTSSGLMTMPQYLAKLTPSGSPSIIRTSGELPPGPCS
jgi:ABC-type branched-subunit amino acid transport system substrate-binding protein